MTARTRALLVGVIAAGSLVAAKAAAAQVAVVSPILMEHDAAAGETYQGAIRLRNLSQTTHRVRLYQTDYLFSADGTNAFNAPGSDRRSNARWLTLGTSEVVLPGAAETTVTFTVAVPTGHPLSGCYWSMVMVEQEDAETPAGAPVTGGMELKPTIRYGVQVATHMPSTDQPRVEFTAPKISGKTITFDVTNPTERGVRPELRMELYSAEGTLLAASDSRRGLLYPDTSLRQSFTLNKELTPGSYIVVILADTGQAQIRGSRYTVTIGK